MTYDLPKTLRQMEVQCFTILRAIKEWRIEPSERRRDQALHRIERSCLQVSEIIGIMPDEKRLYIELVTRQREEIQRLTAANVALAQGRAA